MLPGGTDPFYRRLLTAGHLHYARIEVWRAGVRQAILAPYSDTNTDGLVFMPGSSLSATLTSAVARNLTLVVPYDLFPDEPDALLNPYGSEIRAFYGVTTATGSLTYTWEVFRGKIGNPRANRRSGTCTITCADRAEQVLDAGFVNPQNAQTNNSVSTEFQRLVVDAVPDAEFGPGDTFPQLVSPMAWDFSRTSAIEEMMSSVGALWYPLADGRFVTRRYPWAIPGPPVVTLSERVPGELLDWTKSRDRKGVFNVVTATGERLNGDVPVVATASDTNPLSPTFVDGPFGIRSLPLRRQTPSTQGGALAAAEARLRTALALTVDWAWQVPPDASLELGDIVLLEVDGRFVTQVVQAFQLPLDLSAPMTVQGRAQVIGDVEAGF
jgi:hypothetical protein